MYFFLLCVGIMSILTCKLKPSEPISTVPLFSLVSLSFAFQRSRYISLQKICWTYLPFNASLINASCLFYLNKYKYTRERCHVFYGWPVRSKQVVSWWHHHDIFSGINQNKWWHIYRYTFPVYKKNKKTNNIYEGVCMHRLSGVSIFIDNKKN